MHTEHAKQSYIEVTIADLPLYCPMPRMPLWSGHPKVFIPVEKMGEARCPYCSTLYKLRGAAPQGH